MIDVLVVGAGPAGWALADACARLGVRVTLVAPRPHAPWRPTYGMWEDETGALPLGARWVSARARVLAGGSRWLSREYAILDNESVRVALTHPEVSVVAGRAVEVGPRTVTLADGHRLNAEVVINATGAYGLFSRPPELSDLAGKMEIGGPPDRANGPFARRSSDRDRAGGPDQPDSADEPGRTVELPQPGPAGEPGDRRRTPEEADSASDRAAARTAPHASAQRPEMSDPVDRLEIGGPPASRANGPFARRSPHRGRAEQTAYGVFVSAEAAAPLVSPGEAIFMDWRQPAPGPATFLYAVPTPDGRVLLEETSLAARPGLSMATLRDRLHARLTKHGISPDGATERVRFPVDRPPNPHAFGAAAGITHPATGYGVADMLALAPTVAKAIARGGPVHRAIWSPQAKAVRRLRLAGLATILALPPDRLPGFFALFFDLPPHHQRAFLSGRADLPGTARAMAALFRAAPWSLRRSMIAPFR